MILSDEYVQHLKFENLNLNADVTSGPSSGLAGHSQAFVSGVKACKGRKSFAVGRDARVRNSFYLLYTIEFSTSQ